MASSAKIGSQHPLRALTVAAACALALAMAIPAGVASGQDQGIDRTVIPVAPDAPSRYVVQPGDTLWDISAKFLTDPWYWPEIWHINPQVANPHLIYPGDELALTWVDGRPQVTLASGGPVRLSPRVRTHPLSEAIHSLPYERIAVFMQRPTVLTADQVDSSPYVAAGRDERLASSVGNDIYVRRMKQDAIGTHFMIYHVGDELRDPENGDVLGYQGIYTGEANLTRLGKPATMRIVDSSRETLDGDILLPVVIDPKVDFVPRSAPTEMKPGQIMSVIDERTVVADYDIVIINRGSKHGLAPGHVLEVWQAGQEVYDQAPQRESRTVVTPNERNGLAMIFKAYPNMSYGLMWRSDREVMVGDMVKSPEHGS